MSSATDAAAATVALFKTLYTESYCELAAPVLFMYEALVTLDRDMACFWTKRWSGASLLFFANKWISMAACASIALAANAIEALQLVPGAVFSALRAYALGRSKLLGLLVFGLSMSPVGANMAIYDYHLSGEVYPPFGCLDTDSTTDAINVSACSFGNCIVIIISRVPLMVADILLIYITWATLSSRDMLRGIQRSERLSLADIFFRDGIVYFVVMLILNILHLVFSLTAVAINFDIAVSYLTIFTAPITAILVSRFLLDLQEAHQVVIRVNSSDPLQFSRDPYDEMPSFIASLGAVISTDLPTDSEPHVDSSLDYGEGDGTVTVQPKCSQAAASSSSG